MKSTIFSVPGLDCPSEEKLIRNKLAKIIEITHLQFNFINQELKVSHDLTDVKVIEVAIAEIGMQATVKDVLAKRANKTPVSYRQWILIASGGALAIAAEIISYCTGNEKTLLILIPSLIAMALTGWPTFKKGVFALRTFTLNINFLMMIAITGAFFIGQWPEAAMVTVLFALAELIERYSLDKARHAIEALMAMAPEEALVKLGNEWQITPIANININAIIYVKPGDRIPLDGILTFGQSSVNQASVTGESMPVEKNIGATVYAGTMNESGFFEFQVTATASNTLLAKIIRTVEEAQAVKAPTQRFVDHFSKYYTPLMVVIAILIAMVPPLIYATSFYPWVYKALVLLVIACPCALVISTPVTVVSGLAAAAKLGLLIKGGIYLENGHKLRVIALDKTGTITQGKPVITDVITFHSLSKAELLVVAASLDTHSKHPVAQAIVNSYQATSINTPLFEISQFSSLPGRGVQGVIEGIQYYVGNHQLTEDNRLCSPELEVLLENFEREGKTTVVVSTSTEVLGVIAVADSVRSTSAEAIRQLHQLGIKTVMITGDNSLTAQAIAKQVGVDEVYANSLPNDKLTTLEKLLKNFQYVGMVGDGINDAPALAKATIGFAMGSESSDIALETADVALIENNLTKLPLFIQLSKKTAVTLRQNIGFAIIVKVVFFSLALAGKSSLWMAVFADMGASLIVVFNGLKLLKFKPKLHQ